MAAPRRGFHHWGDMDDEPGGTEAMSATETSGAAPPPAAAPRRLYRRTDDRVIAGVASGLADYLKVDPVLVRVGFIALTVLGGAGILAYLAMWWIVPPVDAISSPGERAMARLKNAPRWVAVFALVLGVALLADQLNVTRAEVVWGLALVAIGVLLFRETGSRADGDAVAAVSAPGAAAAVATESRLGAIDGPGEPLGPAVGPPSFDRPGPPAWIPPRRRPRERSRLGVATLGLAFVALGVAVMLSTVGPLHLSLSQFLAIPLAVIGLGLLVGAWWGRARWLIALAFVLAPFVLVGSLVSVPLEGGAGERNFAPATVAAAERPFHLVAGSMSLNLTGTDLAPGQTLTASATVMAGEIVVLVPRSAHVLVHARAGAGAMNVMDTYEDGLSVDQEVARGPGKGPRIELDLAVSFGRIVVTRI
jgi:phage shock protein PspC (stress-responsive transcriptional regulator)